MHWVWTNISSIYYFTEIPIILKQHIQSDWITNEPRKPWGDVLRTLSAHGYSNLCRRTSVLHIWYKYQGKLDALHSAPTYLCSHRLAVIFPWSVVTICFSWLSSLQHLLKIPLIFQHRNWSSNNTVYLPIKQSIFQHNSWSSNDIWSSNYTVDLPLQ